jgi:hypothetical protein
VAPRRPMGKRGPETARSPAGVAVVVLTGAPHLEGARSACRGGDAVTLTGPQHPCLRVSALWRRAQRRLGRTRLGAARGAPHGW